MAKKKLIILEVKEMLEKRGYTQREFSEVSGIVYKTVGRLCTNKVKNPDLENLARCCDVLDCDITDIMKLVEVEGEYGEHIRPRIVPRYNSRGLRIDKDE